MLGHNRLASKTPFQWQNRCRANNSPLSRQTFLDPRMAFKEKFILQYNGTFDIPTYKYQLLQKMAYAKLIQIVIVFIVYKPHFYSPPPPPHTHTCVGAIRKGSLFEKCFLSEVITPLTLNTKFAPLSPHKNISDPPTPYPLPLCVVYHNIDSSDQWRVQGDSGGFTLN